METNELKLEVQDLNQQSILLLQAGNLTAAKEKLNKAMELDPMCMEIYKNYGDISMVEENYTSAKSYYKKALLIQKQGELYFLYGNACFMNDEVHEGLEHYNLAISNGYDNDEMLFFMGMAYTYLKDNNMALRFFQKAHMKNPSRPDYLIKKITTAIQLGELEMAEHDIDTLLRTAPEYFDGYQLKIQLLIHQGKLDQAIEIAKLACDKFPEDSELMHSYVRCIALKGDYAKALKLIEQAKQMKYFSDSERNFTILEGEIAAEGNDFARAIQCCEHCITLENENFFDGEARFMLINLYLASSNYENALKCAKEIKNRANDDTFYYAALYYVPFCLSKLGKEEEAKKEYKEANSFYRLITLKNPSAMDAYLYRVMCLKDMEEYTKALEIADFMEGLKINSAEVYIMKADIYSAMGQEALAKQYAEKAYELKPQLKPIKNGEA